MQNGLKFILIFCVAFLPFFGKDCMGSMVNRRSIVPERTTSDDYPDYLSGIKYDEYPMIVPKKRTALLLDRLLVALQKAIDEEEMRDAEEAAARQKNNIRPEDAVRTMDLQRRGHGTATGAQKGRVYWRCYFNAVTCF